MERVWISQVAESTPIDDISWFSGSDNVQDILEKVPIGYSQSFILTDWIDDGDELYYIDVTHNFQIKYGAQTYKLVGVSIYDIWSNRVWVHEEHIENLNLYRIYVPKDPDCRFEGEINLDTIIW